MIQLSQMHTIVLPSGFQADQKSLNSLARDSGLAWGTVRTVLQGQGTIFSLDRLRSALGLQWSWTSAKSPQAAGVALGVKRKAKGLSQRAMAAKLRVSPQTIVTLETKFRGRIDTLRRYLRVLRIIEVLSTPSKRLVPEQNEADADLVYTPRDLAAQIITTFKSEMAGTVLDPSRGSGAFYDAFPASVNKKWCEVDEGHDFFDWTEPVDWIITNPPWSRIKDFLRHSLRVADNVVFLALLSHFTTKSRISMISDAGFALKRIVFVPTPAEWPASGFQAAAVHVQRGWKGPSVVHDLDVQADLQ